MPHFQDTPPNAMSLKSMQAIMPQNRKNNAGIKMRWFPKDLQFVETLAMKSEVSTSVMCVMGQPPLDTKPSSAYSEWVVWNLTKFLVWRGKKQKNIGEIS